MGRASIAANKGFLPMALQPAKGLQGGKMTEPILKHKPTTIPVPPQEPGRPFVVEIERPANSNKPSSRSLAGVKITRSLRTSGFWQALPAPELKSLILLFTFVQLSGQCVATLSQLARAMPASENKTRTRMQRLTRCYWQGQPVVKAFQRGDGLDAYRLSSRLR
jgi:hypothetical protein